MDQITAFDRSLFERINLDWTNGFFDWLFPAITDLHKSPVFIAIAVALLGVWIYRKRKVAAKFVLVLVLAIGIADAFNYRVLKHAFLRDRPQDSGVSYQLRSHQHSGPSFPSNHAANIAAAATVLSAGVPVLAPLWITIAFLVAYSRVYVGVHFPLDVTAGALVGFLVATILLRLSRRWLRNDGDSSRART